MNNRADVEIGSHLRVRRSLLDVDRVEADLWVSNLSYETKQKLGYRITRESPGIRLWEEDGDYLILPRGYGPPYVSPYPDSWDDYRPAFRDTAPWVFRRTLRPEQEPAATSLFNGGRDKLLCLGCGKGKTLISLWYAGQRRKKTLVIVDRDFLVDQWSREIKTCYWMTRDEIGLVQGPNRRVGDHITIGMIHTLSQQEFDAEFYDQFGLVIVDEAHLLGAETFSKVLPNFPGERLLLTATPTRSDGMHPVFMYHAGGLTPCYTDISRERSSSWFFIHMPRLMEEYEENSCYRRLPGLRKANGDDVYAINRPKYDSKASVSELFNRIIIDEVMKAAGSGRNVLVLGSRVEQLEMLASLVGEYYPTGCVTGAVKGNERLEEFKRQVLFCTDRIGSRALDVPRLDTLLLLFPSADPGFIRQTVGRIDRELEGKGNPIVVVFCHQPLERTCRDMENAIRQVDQQAVVRHLRR